jgi:hypothetical protein
MEAAADWGSLGTVLDRDGASGPVLAHHRRSNPTRSPRGPRTQSTRYPAVVGSEPPRPSPWPWLPTLPGRHARTAFRSKPQANAIGQRYHAEHRVSHGGKSLWHALFLIVSERQSEVSYLRPAASLVIEAVRVRGVETPAARSRTDRGVVSGEWRFRTLKGTPADWTIQHSVLRAERRCGSHHGTGSWSRALAHERNVGPALSAAMRIVIRNLLR